MVKRIVEDASRMGALHHVMDALCIDIGELEGGHVVILVGDRALGVADDDLTARLPIKP